MAAYTDAVAAAYAVYGIDLKMTLTAPVNRNIRLCCRTLCHTSSAAYTIVVGKNIPFILICHFSSSSDFRVPLKTGLKRENGIAALVTRKADDTVLTHSQES